MLSQMILLESAPCADLSESIHKVLRILWPTGFLASSRGEAYLMPRGRPYHVHHSGNDSGCGEVACAWFSYSPKILQRVRPKVDHQTARSRPGYCLRPPASDGLPHTPFHVLTCQPWNMTWKMSKDESCRLQNRRYHKGRSINRHAVRVPVCTSSWRCWLSTFNLLFKLSLLVSPRTFSGNASGVAPIFAAQVGKVCARRRHNGRGRWICGVTTGIILPSCTTSATYCNFYKSPVRALLR